MKKSHEVPPLRVGAHVHPDRHGLPRLEWSRVEDFEETVDIGFPSNKAGAFVLRIKRWIDTHLGSYEDEIRMLRRLHRTERLEIVVTGDSNSPEEIGTLVDDYWQTRQTRHNRRMLIAGLAVLPAIVLSILPGPNVIGIPLAYLAWHHWRIVKGLKKVRSGAIHVEMKSSRSKRPISIDSSTSLSGPKANLGNEPHQTADVQHS
jgi:hypothetical protein